ncbi:MAG: RNA polymerase-binding protein RbpA [Candidatus Nanopelagicales bacterium]|nr:RNA polymerase-binding protein RbpA [Candidatus Nanopelagicales bacterium]
MNELSMRGSRIGALSYENDLHVVPAARQVLQYVCPEGHATVIPFSIEAEDIPHTWGCRCGREAKATSTLENMASTDVKEERYVRTHWDMLLERRTIGELEELLNERLALLHAHELPALKSA